MSLGNPTPALLAAAALALVACGHEATPSTQAATPAGGPATLHEARLKYLVVETAGEAGPAAGAWVPGRIELRPEAISSLGAPAAGRIVSVRARPGEHVKAGAELVVIQSADAAAARAALLQADVRAAAAEANLRRHEEMMAKGVGLEIERLEAQTQAAEARLELDRARKASALFGAGQGDIVVLRAPAPGVVVSVKAAVGAVVAPGGEALVELADKGRLWAVADVPESDVDAFASGQRVSVHIRAAGRNLDGTVEGFGARVQAETRRLPLYVALRGDLRGLAPGMYAELRFSGRGRPELTLPVTAVLIKDGHRRIVYVQRTDGTFEPREVRIGRVTDGRVTVHDGLKPGERVVVRGALLLDAEAEQQT